MSSQDRQWADHRDGQYNDKGYALSGRIMLSAIVVLFFVVVLMVCLHIYARWYLLRARRRSHRRRRSARGNLVFHVDGAAAAASRGLDAAVLRALPVFVVGKESAAKVAGECAVCLSEFEAGEAGRRLPKCGHSFHTECIDMWFHSHSTCPLCRSPVEAGSEPEIRLEIDSAAVDLDRTGPVSGPASPHGLCSDCEASSSVESRRKPAMSVSIDVPRRNLESFGESGSAESPASHTTSFRSPMSRMLSLTRILSREKRNGGVSPSGNFNGNNVGNNSASCSSVNELDIERGKEVTQ